MILSACRHSTEITMPWTEITRPHYGRRCARCASDLTDAEWALIAPLIPSANRIGRPRKTDLREVVNALLDDLLRWRMAASAEGLPAVLDGAEILLSLARRSTMNW
jgi:hypothetical protein